MLPHFVVGLLWLATLPFWSWVVLSDDEPPLVVDALMLAIILILALHYVVEWRRERADRGDLS